MSPWVILSREFYHFEERIHAKCNLRPNLHTMSAIVREKISLFAICCVWGTLFGLKTVLTKEGKRIFYHIIVFFNRQSTSGS